MRSWPTRAAPDTAAGTLVDCNVLLDILTEDPAWQEWSMRALADVAEEGPLCIEPSSEHAEVSIGILDRDAHLPRDLTSRIAAAICSASALLAKAVEEVAGDLLDLGIPFGEAVHPLGGARGDDGAATGGGVGAEHGVAVGDPVRRLGAPRSEQP